MTSGALYLYGVTRHGGGDGDLDVDVTPIGGEGRVFPLVHGGLAAVVSEARAERYELSRRNVRGHQAVLDALFERRTVVPARFGTVVTGADALVADLLEGRHAELTALLERLDGQVELGLKASWSDLNRVFIDIVAASPELRAARDRLARRGGAVGYEQRVELGRRAAAALEVRSEREGDALLDALGPLAGAVRRNETLGDAMVLNAALLMERTRTAALDAALAVLDADRGGSLVFTLSGPFPPYSFVDLAATPEGDGAAEGRETAGAARR